MKKAVIILLSLAIVCFTVAGILYFTKPKEQPKAQYELIAETCIVFVEENYPQYKNDPNMFCHMTNIYLSDKCMLYTANPVIEKLTVEKVAELLVQKFPDTYSSYGWRRMVYEKGTIDYMMILYGSDQTTYSFSYFAVSERRWAKMNEGEIVEVPGLETWLTCKDEYVQQSDYPLPSETYVQID